MEHILVLKNNTIELSDFGRALTGKLFPESHRSSSVAKYIDYMYKEHGVSILYDGFNAHMWYSGEGMKLLASPVCMPHEVDQEVLWYARLGGAWFHLVPMNAQEESDLNARLDNQGEDADKRAEEEDRALLARTYGVY